MDNNYEYAYIYTLTDPSSNIVYYIGKSVNPSHRLASHLSAALEGNYPVNIRTRQIVTGGMLPALSIIEKVLYSEWEATERKWIEHFRLQGSEISNASSGGQGIDNKLRSKGEDHYRAVYSNNLVLDMREDAMSGMSFADISRKYEVATRNVQKICKGINWKDAPGPIITDNRKKVLTDEQEEQVKELYNSGSNRADIQRLFGVNYGTIVRITGGYRQERKILTDEEVRSVREDRAAGTPLSELAIKYGIHSSGIAGICLGKTRMKAGGPITKRDVISNDDIFEIIRLHKVVGLSQGQIAKQFKIGQSSVSRIIRGTHKPK